MTPGKTIALTRGTFVGKVMSLRFNVLSRLVRVIRTNNRMISVRFQGKPFNITVIQVYVLTSNEELLHAQFSVNKSVGWNNIVTGTRLFLKP